MLKKLKGKLDRAVTATIGEIERFWWLGTFVALLLMLNAAVAFLAQDITIAPWNRINWDLAILGNFYLAILMLAISGPFLICELESMVARGLYSLGIVPFLAYIIVLYRGDLGPIWRYYPRFSTDFVILIGAAIITVLVRIRTRR